MNADTKELALALLGWHGGQSCPIYLVGSRMYAQAKGRHAPCTAEQLHEAARQLRAYADRESAHMRLNRMRELQGLAHRVEWLADHSND